VDIIFLHPQIISIACCIE